MSREGALLLMIGIAVVLIGLMAWGWRRRLRRDAGRIAPFGEIPESAAILAVFSGLYVATTAHDDPLERLAIRGLAYRSAVTATVTDRGLALALTGQEPIFVERERLVSADQATVTIDRVVERDGLTRVSWRLDDATVVDSYLRPQEASARAFAASLDGILRRLQRWKVTHDPLLAEPRRARSGGWRAL